MKIYNNDIEALLDKGWVFNKIIKVKGKSTKYFLLERPLHDYKEYLDYLKTIRIECRNFKKIEELEEEEKYWVLTTYDDEFYDRATKIFAEFNIEVREVEIPPTSSRSIKDFIKL